MNEPNASAQTAPSCFFNAVSLSMRKQCYSLCMQNVVTLFSNKSTYLGWSVHNCKSFCVPMLNVCRTVRPLKHSNLCRKLPKVCRSSTIKPQPLMDVMRRGAHVKKIFRLCSPIKAYTNGSKGTHFYARPHKQRCSLTQSLPLPSGDINSIVQVQVARASQCEKIGKVKSHWH